MIRLALLAGQNRPARAKEIAEQEDISEDYAEQILIRLKAAGLVESHRGARGGFTLAKPPASISVADILTLVEGPMRIAPCLDEPSDRSTVCVTRDLWMEAQETLMVVFRKALIGDLCAKVRERGARSLEFSI